MSTPITVVDAFADRPFSGNPAAVCVLNRAADEAWMKLVAREMNLSETAFLYPLDGSHRYGLRWLTPSVEVDLCGHATLAAAHVLWEGGHVPRETSIRFETRSGELSAVFHRGEIELDFPELPVAETQIPEGLASALGAEVVKASTTGMDLLVELEDESTVRAVAPVMAVLERLPYRGVIVTSASTGTAPYDFVSRFFAPQSGVPEDPVTGSAHCALAPYWGDRLGRSAMLGYQASARGGSVRVLRDRGRVKLGGRAITVLRGEIHDGVA